MGQEIERAFIVTNDQWKQDADTAQTVDIVQGYIASNGGTVRVRLSTNQQSGEQKGYLTIKSKRDPKQSIRDRSEWEFEIPVQDATDMLAQVCRYSVQKTRYVVPVEGKKWTVDVFADRARYHGLVIAEIEMSQRGETVNLPSFVSAESEVSDDDRFTNRALSNPENPLPFLRKMIANARGEGIARK